MIVYEFLSQSSVCTDDLHDINLLIETLSRAKTAPKTRWDTLYEAVRHSRVLVARDETRRRTDWSSAIVGMATLTPKYKVSNTSGDIEEVVVDPRYQGQGIGRKLTEKLIEEARRLTMTELELTSHPSRIAANELYKSLDFKLRQNAYRLMLI
ncbi:MAG: GNAT family N-acetyltransferase [bacterium]|nr:GNAT family N-acetyltransferase [bacterium]